ncbi:flap endonuclease-1 [Candidatus Woesearchaeota archaeon]|jgi:flap endonuclease-1|nr:flap endonuclease-1 [Candidatus Woesearchaeota archaeon]MBT4367747.1 flap endonuclease-1 [Candidatus Woesearchaeota archaeon]MBT4712235.1 flap endonuclease-1 [Candidatus Woesearchaeota archaeon]MBT6638783.1 flap endonuclease-1 [Candidatus Woesearchaeota archaeon]MBT7134427.1 flap endonuclease-1 [Candidatus Woesearchaeota archaeon]
MGVSLKELITKEEIELKDLSGKVLAFDAFNMLYQFLTTIRAVDGSPLTDSKGHVTSHLIGLFSRLVRFLEAGIKPIFVFDGEAPDLKKKERERRKKLKLDAEAKYKVALQEKDVDSMKKFASRSSKLTEEMVNDAKELIAAFGIPIVQAPSEGEAQAAYMVEKGEAFACVSQDYDSLLFGCNLLIHNLSIAGKRKKIHGLGYKTVKPELIRSSEVFNKLGIDRDKLIVLSMCIGTDFNVGGIKGVGPKGALKKVKETDDWDALFKELKWDDFFPYPWEEVFYLFKKLPHTDDYVLEWSRLNKDKIKTLLVENHDFAIDRVESSLEKLKKSEDKKKQKSLGDFM